ncbi:hypothetical protein GQ457_15G008710 [Hibiscus cannabinus]
MGTSPFENLVCSYGRALASHARGTGFDSPHLHLNFFAHFSRKSPFTLQSSKVKPKASLKEVQNPAMVRKEIQDETDRMTGKSKHISPVQIHLSIYLPKVGLKPNCIILAITPANQYIATSDAMKLSREVDPTGERSFGVLTKLDLMDKGTNAIYRCKLSYHFSLNGIHTYDLFLLAQFTHGRAYPLQHLWFGIVKRSQADINKNVNMIASRRKEREFFATSSDYGHLASKMGSEYLAKVLSQHLESVIRAQLPGITSLINKSIEELEAELSHLGRSVAVDAGAQLYTILELRRAFDRIYKDHLDGGRPGGDRIIYGVFDHQLPAALRKLLFDRHLSLQNISKVVSEADG